MRSSRQRASVPPEMVEQAICEVWLGLAVKPQDWVRLARVRPALAAKVPGVPRELVDAVLMDMARRLLPSEGFQAVLVHLAPDSNRKVLTSDDHEASVRLGREEMHLLAIEDDYFTATGWRKRGRRWVR